MRHALRILLITLALALIGLALTPRATPAQVIDPCVPDRPIPYGWHLRPASPCGGDSVTVVFTACRPCVEILGYERPNDSSPLRLNLRMKNECLLGLMCLPDSLEVPLGRLAVGRHEMNYRVRAGVVVGDSDFCFVERPDSLGFLVGCPEPPPPGTLPYTGKIQIGPPPPCAGCAPRICPGEPIPFSITGSFPSGCYRFRSLELLPSPIVGPGPQPPVVRIHVDQRTCGVCTLDVPPWAADTVLAGLPPGTYGLMLQMVVARSCGSLPPDSVTYYAGRTFTVKDSCLTSPLPFVTRVRIGRPPICPGAPIPFWVEGTLPTSCYQFRKLELLPSPLMRPGPVPPVVRIVVAENDCMDWACLNVVTPWQARTLLPSLPTGSYDLMMQLDVVSMCDSTRVNATYRTAQSFAVRDSCGPPPPEPCLTADWVHPNRDCDDFITPGGVAKSVMTVVSSARLAGLQGRLSLYPPGLRISRLEPVGAAQGMHIAWTPKENGAEFVLFAEAGAPIGGVRCGIGGRCQQPILAVSMVPDTDGVLAPVTHLSVGDLLGSDSLGNAVPECPIMTLVAVESRICAGPSCDFNRDGRLDVRDLVTMVHCVRGTGPCPDDSLARFDCNRDGRLGVDDVMCCARVILNGGERDTTPGRPEPSMAIEIGEAAWEAGGLQVPVRVRGAERLGAARLALALPLDRYRVTGVELAAENPDWLALNEAVDGQLVLGLVGLAPADPAEVARTVELTLHLELKPGQVAGGEIGLADVQLSGPDGVTLMIATSPFPVPLPAPGALMLSAARPNPFNHETSFALNLDRTTDVDLAVHDLSGRRIATLHRGALGAGPHEFVWRGVRSDGSAAANGIYFLQARVGGERFTRKVIFLRGN